MPPLISNTAIDKRQRVSRTHPKHTGQQPGQAKQRTIPATRQVPSSYSVIYDDATDRGAGHQGRAVCQVRVFSGLPDEMTP
jgi:hypothetical protein